MCQIMEDYAEKRAYRAAIEKSISIAIKLLDNGMRDLQQIANLTDLPLDEVKKLFEGITS